MGEARECPRCGVRYRSAEMHRRVHEEADKTQRRIDQAVADRVRGRKRNL